MARLRMFGPLAEAVGIKAAVVDGSTVGEVLRLAEQRYGPAFAGRLPSCQVWVNGEVAALDRELGETDEVAVLPPTSGG